MISKENLRGEVHGFVTHWIDLRGYTLAMTGRLPRANTTPHDHHCTMCWALHRCTEPTCTLTDSYACELVTGKVCWVAKIRRIREESRC